MRSRVIMVTKWPALRGPRCYETTLIQTGFRYFEVRGGELCFALGIIISLTIPM